VEGVNMTSDETCGLAFATSGQQSNLQTLRDQLQKISAQIVDKINALDTENSSINTNMADFKQQYKQNLSSYNSTTNKINKLNEKKDDNTLNSMASDSDIIVLQENYKYLFWSIFAVSLLTFTLSNINKNA
jgi:chromosome segregation ATPase